MFNSVLESNGSTLISSDSGVLNRLPEYTVESAEGLFTWVMCNSVQQTTALINSEKLKRPAVEQGVAAFTDNIAEAHVEDNKEKHHLISAFGIDAYFIVTNSGEWFFHVTIEDHLHFDSLDTKKRFLRSLPILTALHLVNVLKNTH